MISLFQSAILGVVEGFTEFLPISSTAHLTLVAELLSIPQTNFTKTFEIAIQSGAILAVLILYVKKFFDIDLLKKLFVAFIPTAIIGLIFYSFIKDYLLGNTGITLSALFLGGILLILFELYVKHQNTVSDLHAITFKKAFYIGLFQSVAIIPGVSRAGATIVGGMLMGLKREVIVEFSFLLAVPTMLAATGFDLLKSYKAFSGAEFGVLAVGFITSFVMAIVSIKFLLSFIKTRTFIPFGIYRIILVVVIIGMFYI